MALNSGKRGFVNEINVTPFVDVMLVLLIIFMVTAPMMTQGLEVELPATSEAAPLPSDDQHIVLSISQAGELLLNEFPATMGNLIPLLTTNVKQQNKRLYLKADKNVPYGIVVEVMGRAKAAGIENIGMVADLIEDFQPVSPESGPAPAATIPPAGASRR